MVEGLMVKGLMVEWLMVERVSVVGVSASDVVCVEGLNENDVDVVCVVTVNESDTVNVNCFWTWTVFWIGFWTAYVYFD